MSGAPPRTAPSMRGRLLDGWRQLRDADRLGSLLPRSTNRVWEGGGAAYGFVTVDYRVYRELVLSSPTGTDPGSVADLVEMYWSVRTHGGAQDPQWAAALNAHVIQVQEGALTVNHLDRLYRLVVTLRRSLQLGGIGDLTAAGKPVALHARGLLLGPSLSKPVAIVDALANHADVPLTVGRYSEDRPGEFLFSSSGGESRFYLDGGDGEQLRALGERLLRHDRLFKSQGRWEEGPPGPRPSITDEPLDR